MANPSCQPAFPKTSSSTSDAPSNLSQQAKLPLPKKNNFLKRALEDLEMGPVRGRDLKRTAAASSLPLWSSTNESSDTDVDYSTWNSGPRLPCPNRRRRIKKAVQPKPPEAQESDSTDLIPWWRDNSSPVIKHEATSSTSLINEDHSSTESLNISLLSNKPAIFSTHTSFSHHLDHKWGVGDLHPIWRNRILSSHCKSNPETVNSSNPQSKLASTQLSSVSPRTENYWDDDDSLWSKSSEELQLPFTGRESNNSLVTEEAEEKLVPQYLLKKQSMSEFPGFIRIYPISVSSCGIHANYPLDTSDTDLYYSDDPFYANTRQFVEERMAEISSVVNEGAKEQSGTPVPPSRPYSSSFQTSQRRRKNQKRNFTLPPDGGNDSQVDRHSVVATSSVP